ncbi:unnamed protein product [Rangifer tarandus platyrhynchus]|uniref:Uncharacterized protein n=2 Tax=Rangifer tarandus platyrhynchus TaxID=3082113 RepID=A0ACB0FCU9_RANTA|nr:unnamed protein product [Rangifer tarandus platyrhynchus]CAI9710726.1 unnamed protein product [Rangifer tarandus platyrhynchus]
MSSFCPAEQKVMCQGSKDPVEKKKMPLLGLGGSRENLSSNTVPQTPASFPSAGCTRRLHPKINKGLHRTTQPRRSDPRPRQRHAGQAEQRPPRGLQVGPGRGQARPRQGSLWRGAGAGPLVTYRRLMVPRRLRPNQALTDCARQPRLSLGSPAEIQERPFKRRRARGPPG